MKIRHQSYTTRATLYSPRSTLRPGPARMGSFFKYFSGICARSLATCSCKCGHLRGRGIRGSSAQHASGALGQAALFLARRGGAAGEAHPPLFLGQCLILALPCAASCSCAKRKRFMSGEAPCTAADGGERGVRAGGSGDGAPAGNSVVKAHRLRDGALRVVEQPVGERVDLLVSGW